MKASEFPKEWHIARGDNFDEWKEVITWFNNGLGSEEYYIASSGMYYPNFHTRNGFLNGYHSGNKSIQHVGYTKITYNDFKEHVLNKFVVPEKWYIEGCEELGEYIQSLVGHNRTKTSNGDIGGFKYFNNGSLDDIYDWKHSRAELADYTKITFEQFKEYIMKDISFDENDWNIETKTAEEFNEVCEYVNSIHTNRFTCYETDGLGFSGGARFIRFNELYGECGYCDVRNSAYPIKKSITWKQFKSLKDSLISEKPKTITGYKLIKKIEGYATEVGRISYDKSLFCLYKDNPNFEPVYLEYKSGDWVYVGDPTSYWDSFVKIIDVADGHITALTKQNVVKAISLPYIQRLATPEEVEKLNTKVITMNGQFDLTIKNNRVYHKSEDITEYVLGMKDWIESMPATFKRSKYGFIIKDVIFDKTGCEHKETKLSDWCQIWEQLTF